MIRGKTGSHFDKLQSEQERVTKNNTCRKVPGDEGLPAGERLIAVDPGALSAGAPIGGHFVRQGEKDVLTRP